MINTTRPKLKPSKEFSFLVFSRVPRADIIEVYLPNHESYLVDWVELEMFLDKSGVRDVNGLTSHIYNFCNVLWRRADQGYHHIDSKYIAGDDEASEFI